jgi:hypothetical protein
MSALPESPRRFTTAELAVRFRLSEQRLRARRLAGLPPRFLKIGARVLYDEKEVLAYEANRTFGSTTETRPEIESELR